MNESEETEEIKTFPLNPYLLQGQQALPNCKPISVGRPGDVRYTTSLPHPNIPSRFFYFHDTYMYIVSCQLFDSDKSVVIYCKCLARFLAVMVCRFLAYDITQTDS